MAAAPKAPPPPLIRHCYKDLVKLLESHYKVRPSYHRSLICFQQRKKKAGESLRDLYVDLEALAKDVVLMTNLMQELFMAIDAEVYFPNLVAENLDLKTMISIQTLECILYFEKAFVREKLPTKPSDVSAIGIGSGSFKGHKKDSCRHCGYPHHSEDCRFSHLTCSVCNTKGHLKKVCRFNKESTGKTIGSQVRSSYGNNQKDSFCKSNRNKKSGKKKTNAVFEKFPKEESDSDDNQLLTVEVRPNIVHRPIGSIPVVDCVDDSVPLHVAYTML